MIDDIAGIVSLIYIFKNGKQKFNFCKKIRDQVMHHNISKHQTRGLNMMLAQKS